MRRLLVLTLLVALAAPAAAYAVARSPGDGTLSVRNGQGVVNVNVRGAIIGRFDSGTLFVKAKTAADCDDVQVWGPTRERPIVDENGDVECRFIGRDVRFRLVGGQRSVRIRNGRDIDLAVVGRGFVYLRGIGVQDGQYSVNGEAYQSLPDEGGAFELSAPSAP